MRRAAVFVLVRRGRVVRAVLRRDAFHVNLRNASSDLRLIDSVRFGSRLIGLAIWPSSERKEHSGGRVVTRWYHSLETQVQLLVTRKDAFVHVLAAPAGGIHELTIFSKLPDLTVIAKDKLRRAGASSAVGSARSGHVSLGCRGILGLGGGGNDLFCSAREPREAPRAGVGMSFVAQVGGTGGGGGGLYV